MNELKMTIRVIMITLFIAIPIYGQDSKARLYIWNFTADKVELNDLASKFTSEFEEALTKSQCYQVLERRNFPQLKKHVDNEKGISALNEMSPGGKKALQFANAQIVVFGTVLHDVDSGEYKVTASFQRFDSTKDVSSIRIPLGKIKDAGTREQAMRDLISNICKPSVGSQGVGDPPPPSGYPEIFVGSGSITVRLNECKRSEGYVVCDIAVTNKSERDRNITTYARGTTMTDRNGNRYEAALIQVGNDRNTNYVNTAFFSQIKQKVSITFPSIPRETTTIAVLSLYINNLWAKIPNVSIGN